MKIKDLIKMLNNIEDKNVDIEFVCAYNSYVIKQLKKENNIMQIHLTLQHKQEENV